MAKKAAVVEDPECEGFGIAYDEDDEDCISCEDAGKCKLETEGEPVPAKTPAKKGASVKKKAAVVEEEELDLDASVEDRLDAIEARLDAMESGGGGEKKSKKTKVSAEEKAAAKNAITAEGPYTKAVLTEMPARDVKRYASGIGVNSFAKSKEDVITECLAAQKTAAGKKAIKTAAAAVEEE